LPVVFYRGFFHLSCLHIKKHLEFGYFLFIMVHF
jgi:hypothetical protein